MRMKKECREEFNHRKLILKVIDENTLIDGVGNQINVPERIRHYVQLAMKTHLFDGVGYIRCRHTQDDKYVQIRPVKNYTANTCFKEDSDINKHPLIRHYIIDVLPAKKIRSNKAYLNKKSHEIKDGRELEKPMADADGNYNAKWTENLVFGYEKEKSKSKDKL